MSPIHHVFANRSNAGDWMSARGIQKALGDIEVVEHLCDDPFVEGTLEELASAPPSTVVVGGGGLLMDYFTPLWEGLARLVDRHRVCVWGVGYCDLKMESSRPPTELVREVASSAEIFVVRDQHTKTILDIPSTSAPVPCPSICAIEVAPLGGSILHCNNFTTAGVDVYAYMRAACMRFAADTDSPFEETNNRFEADRRRSLDKVLGRYERAGVVVSSALHGCIIGLAMGRPIIAVSGDHKIDSFMEAAGLDEWLLDLEDAERLPELLSAIGDQPDSTAFLERARAENRAVAVLVHHVVSHRGDRATAPSSTP